MSAGLIVFLAACVCGLGFFSGAETCILFADRSALRRHVRSGNARAALVERYLARPHWFWTTAMSGAKVCLALAAALACAQLFGRQPGLASGLAGLAFGAGLLFLGRVAPKLYYLPRANQSIVGMTFILRFFMYLFSPLVLLLLGLGAAISAAFGRGRERSSWYTRDELKLLLTAPSSRSFSDEEGRQMIDRIFEFSETRVEEAMIPLVEMDALEDSVTAAEALRKIAQNMYSRYPVYHDRIDNVVGKIATVELMRAGSGAESIKPWIVPVKYVPFNKPVDELLFDMQRENFSLAVVVDEYGGCVGIITREDIVEEIVGEIEDEHDEPSSPFRRLSEHAFLVSAKMEIDELNAALDLDLPEGDYDTLGGFLLFLFRRVPRTGERIRYRDLVFSIVAATPRAVQEARIEIKSPAPGKD
jgi:CBS domain containing-hemolysin-like protein